MRNEPSHHDPKPILLKAINIHIILQMTRAANSPVSGRVANAISSC